MMRCAGLHRSVPPRVVALLVVAACGQDASDPNGGGTPRVVANVNMSMPAVTFEQLGQNIQLTATAVDVAGRVIPGKSFLWSTSNADIAAVDTTGLVTAISPGTVRIQAETEGKRGTTDATVLAASAETTACRGGAPVVLLLVEPVLAPAIRAKLQRFESDLCADGYTVLEKLSVYADAAAVRSYLIDVRSRNVSFSGVILVGKLPWAYQWVTLKSSNPNLPSVSEEVISFQYYADLNGGFATSPGYRSPGNRLHSFDLHTGDLNWEIWVGVLPAYKGDRAATVAALNRYLDKNHAYRAGGAKPPRRFLQVSELLTASTQAQHTVLSTELRTGTFSWQPFSADSNALIFFDSPPGNLAVDTGYARLRQGVADFTVTDTHGFWGASGRLTISWVETNPVGTIFFWSNGCAIGDLDQPDNFLTSSLYSPTSAVLLAKGTTNDSGGMGNNQNGFFGRNVATSMAQGRSMGQAILDHVNVPLVFPWSDSREFHFGTVVVLGDPTLRLRT